MWCNRNAPLRSIALRTAPAAEFAAADANGNARLSAAEVAAARSSHVRAAAVPSFFATADADADGELDAVEFLRAMAAGSFVAADQNADG